MFKSHKFRRFAAVFLAAASCSVAFAASPAQAAGGHVELETSTSQGKLVLAARSTANNSSVSLAFDNNAPTAQWKFIPKGATNFRGSFILRATEGSKPMCLDVQDDQFTVGTNIVVRFCDGTASQNWEFNSSTGLRAVGRNVFVDQPAGPVFATNLELGQSGIPLVKRTVA